MKLILLCVCFLSMITTSYAEVKIISGGKESGGSTTTARLLAPFLSKSLLGNPKVLVSSMYGTGGAKAVKWIVNVGAKDGSVIGAINPAALMSPYLRDKDFGYDPKKLQWIGSISPMNIVIMRWNKDYGNRTLNFGTSSKSSIAYMVCLWYKKLTNYNLKMIPGYRGKYQNIALENGEIDGKTVTYHAFKSIKKDWIINDKIKFISYLGPKNIELDDLGVSRISNFVKTEIEKDATRFLEIIPNVGRGYFVSPGVSKQKVVELRKAFDSAVNSKSFLKTAKKRLIRVDPISGDELQKIVSESLDTSKETLEYFKSSIR